MVMEHVAVNPLNGPFDRILIQISLGIQLIFLHLAGPSVCKSDISVFLYDVLLLFDVSARLEWYVVRLLHESILRHW
jgi:hypothetical protein